MARSALSRRTLLTRAAAVGAGVVTIPVEALFGRGSARGAPQTDSIRRTVSRPQPRETLTAGEAVTLEAIAARLIPTDENGPGAAEAGAVIYIDRALGDALADSREAYRNGLAAVDAYARSSKGMPFASLPASDQDAILSAMESNTAPGFQPNSATFFNLVRNHTIQGTFCDPFYGGNADFVGWDLVGYPGVRLAVSADDQRMDRRPAPARRSAYDHAMFSRKRPSRPGAAGKAHDGN